MILFLVVILVVNFWSVVYIGMIFFCFFCFVFDFLFFLFLSFLFFFLSHLFVRCVERCHKGKCPDCLALRTKTCRCGKKNRELVSLFIFPCLTFSIS